MGIGRERERQVTNWISIKDQEPPKDQPVLITDGKVIVVSFWEDKRKGSVNIFTGPPPVSPYDQSHGDLLFSVPMVGYLWEGYGFESPEWEWGFNDYEITHWMLLPELPGKEEHHDKRTV